MDIKEPSKPRNRISSRTSSRSKNMSRRQESVGSITTYPETSEPNGSVVKNSVARRIKSMFRTPREEGKINKQKNELPQSSDDF